MYCSKCGKENPNDANFCLNCGSPFSNSSPDYELPQIPKSFISQSVQPTQNKPKKKRRKYLIGAIVAVMVLVVAIGILFGNNSSPTINNNTQSKAVNHSTTVVTTTKTTTATTEVKTTSESDFKVSCKTIPYKDIARQPNKYYDEKVVYTGQIVQVGKESDDLYYARINVTKDEYGYYDDTMYVYYKLEENEPKFLEDDIVTFYGECKGEMSYESILGEEITIPEVSAKYIKLVK